MNSSAAVADFHDLETLSVLTNYRSWIVSAFLPHLGARCIEYGAGIGNISEELRPHVEELHLVEPFERSFLKLSDRYRHDTGVRLTYASLESSVAATADEVFDSAVMVNVLEHIEDDLHVVREIHRVLRKHGALCLFVPAHAFLFSAYDRMVGHHRRYELATLCDRIEQAGFAVVRADYFDCLGVLPWLISMRLFGQTRIAPALAELYDTYAVPIGRRLEAVVKPPFGKNILLIARK
jgi:SAM-dependent methyltransferase